MGMGGGGKQTTQETKEIRLPPWVEAASQENYEFAKEVANRPYAAYGGETVAPLNKDFWTARQKVQNLDDYYGNYKDASAALKSILGYNPTDISQRSVTAPTMKDVNLNQYLNPYTSEVEANTVRQMASQGLREQTRLATDATKSGGMGGSRQGIQQAVQGAKTAQAIGDTSAQLRSAGYDKATALAQQDLERQYKAAVQTGDWQQAAEIASRTQDLTAHGQTIQASQGLTETADAAQRARMNEIATRLGFGQMQQEQRQRVDDDKAGKWQKKRDYPLEQLNILLSSLGMSPYGHTETGTSTTRGGGGGGGLGEALGIGKGLMGMLSMFAGGSDRSLKTNIEKLGDVDGLPVYAFDYKSDVSRAKKTKTPMLPKRIGTMAQDVEKILPGAVKKVGGKRVIDMSAYAET